MARYIVFKIIGEKGIPASGDAARSLFDRTVNNGIGLLGSATSGYHFMKDEYGPKTGIGMVKAASSGLTSVRAALALASSDQEFGKLRIDVLGVSGTMKKAREKFMK